MGKKFLGLGGTDHFWDRAKAWILGQITSAVAAKIAEVVANAPEDLDTLKEIADWISAHADDAAAMNTQIQTNKNNIAANTSDISALNTQINTNKSDISSLKTSVAGKADKAHTHSTGDITSGTLPIANGGTGATDAAGGFNALADGVRGSSTPRDDEKMLLKPSGTWYKTTCLDFWNYIKGKISSVLGLTKDNYAGTAAAILDYNRNTPIKVRWGGSGINSADWYPAFNADGSALEPISRTNIHAGTADKTVNDISIEVPRTNESGQYVIPFGNILELPSTATESPYNWDITGFFSIIRPTGHNGSHLWFEAGHGYSHAWTTYAYLDKFDFKNVTTSIKAFQYNGKWWLGLCITTANQGYYSKMTVTYSRGLPATPTCILFYSSSNGVVNEEINNSIQDIPPSWWRKRTIHNPTAFIQKLVIPIGAPSSLEDGCIWIER